jgi:hypothetical protein
MDGGATWFDGPVASVGSTSALAIAGSGARMGVLDDSTGGLWLTGIMAPDPIGSLSLTPESGGLVFTGNAWGGQQVNPIAGHLTLLGNIPTVLQLKLNSPIEERRYVYHVVFTLTGVNLDYIDTITVDEVDDLPVHIIRKDATAILCSLPIELTPGDWTINSVDIYGNHYLATLPIIEDILPVHYP